MDVQNEISNIENTFRRQISELESEDDRLRMEIANDVSSVQNIDDDNARQTVETNIAQREARRQEISADIQRIESDLQQQTGSLKNTESALQGSLSQLNSLAGKVM